MNQPACVTCKFSSLEDNGLLLCRRLAPTVSRAGQNLTLTAMWPVVQPRDWCGEYQLSGNSTLPLGSPRVPEHRRPNLRVIETPPKPEPSK